MHGDLSAIQVQDGFWPGSNDPVLPFEGLWSAVIRQAAFDVYSTDPDIARHAKEWLESHARGVGSLLWICEQLSLNPSAIRRRAKTKGRRQGKPSGYASNGVVVHSTAQP